MHNNTKLTLEELKSDPYFNDMQSKIKETHADFRKHSKIAGSVDLALYCLAAVTTGCFSIFLAFILTDGLFSTAAFAASAITGSLSVVTKLASDSLKDTVHLKESKLENLMDERRSYRLAKIQAKEIAHEIDKKLDDGQKTYWQDKMSGTQQQQAAPELLH